VEEAAARKKRKADKESAATTEESKTASVSSEKKEEPEDDPDTKAARDDDRAERDALVKRMAARDANKTKSLGKKDEDTKPMFSEDEIRDMLPKLREHSRQEYLTKRELQQLELMRRFIKDEVAHLTH
jgi:pre-mRNA-splicing factor ATP-dependent RNA helicase DHX16